MSNDFARVAEVSSRELGARVRLLRVLHIDLWLVVPLLVLSVGGCLFFTVPAVNPMSC